VIGMDQQTAAAKTSFEKKKRGSTRRIGRPSVKYT
jgi:hypothetical protein